MDTFLCAKQVDKDQKMLQSENGNASRVSERKLVEYAKRLNNL